MNAPLELAPPSSELRHLAERISAQPQQRLSDVEIDAWAEALAESVADAED